MKGFILFILSLGYIVGAISTIYYTVEFLQIPDNIILMGIFTLVLHSIIRRIVDAHETSDTDTA